MVRFILSAFTANVKDNQEISQHGFLKGTSCLTNQIAFYNHVTHLVDEGRTWMLSTWTLVRPLTLFPTVSSCRN